MSTKKTVAGKENKSKAVAKPAPDVPSAKAEENTLVVDETEPELQAEKPAVVPIPPVCETATETPEVVLVVKETATDVSVIKPEELTGAALKKGVATKMQKDLDLMNRLKVDVIYKNTKGEYFTTENFAHISEGNKRENVFTIRKNELETVLNTIK